MILWKPAKKKHLQESSKEKKNISVYILVYFKK